MYSCVVQASWPVSSQDPLRFLWARLAWFYMNVRDPISGPHAITMTRNCLPRPLFEDCVCTGICMLACVYLHVGVHVHAHLYVYVCVYVHARVCVPHQPQMSFLRILFTLYCETVSWFYPELADLARLSLPADPRNLLISASPVLGLLGCATTPCFLTWFLGV